uniref:mucosal addressin cell adhesion molecule 1 n=1 Tax=Panthera onca TaxID=9690 RepID=UPI0029535578|nr:mucosal addressin cell adhesion molecule 1 [Panthera onca]
MRVMVLSSQLLSCSADAPVVALRAPQPLPPDPGQHLALWTHELWPLGLPLTLCTSSPHSPLGPALKSPPQGPADLRAKPTWPQPSVHSAAFPAQLTVSPVALVAKQDREVACTAHNVTPVSPEALSLSLLLGDRELEGVQALGRDVEEEPQQGEDLLFRVTERWLLPPLGTPTPPTLHCQATMKLPGLELSHHQPIPVLHRLTSQEPPVTTSPKATPELSSTHSPRSPGPPPGNSSTRPCRPEIHQSPAPGGLELLCEAACGPGMSASWTRAPGGLEAYERQEAGALARLTVPWARCNPEGWFQCRLDPGGQMASLYLVPEICLPTTSAALWPGSLVLGLLFLAFLTHRLWRRCRPAG